MEKEKIKEEFSQVEVDDIFDQFKSKTQAALDEMAESVAAIKSGRATPDIFDDLEVKAYGEM